MQAVSGVSNTCKEGMVGLFSYLSEGEELLTDPMLTHLVPDIIQGRNMVVYVSVACAGTATKMKTGLFSIVSVCLLCT